MDFSHPSKFCSLSLAGYKRHSRIQNAKYAVVHKINNCNCPSYIYLSGRLTSGSVFGLINPSKSSNHVHKLVFVTLEVKV